MWTQDEVRVICRRPQDLEDHPDLALRIRGAFGRRLATMGPPIAGRRDPFARAPAYEVLFGGAAGAGAARPFVIDVDVVGDKVVVDLRLFGAGGFWVDQCRVGLIEALAQGVAIRAGSRHRVAFEPLDCLARRVVAELPPPQVGGVRLTFLTPVAVRVGASLYAAPGALLGACIGRARRLAAWFHVEIEDDFPGLGRLCRDARIVREDLLPFRSARFSQRQRDREIPVSGLLGQVEAEGPLGPLAAYLALAGYTHIGSHAALGMGRVRVSLWP